MFNLFIAIKRKAKYRFGAAAMILLYVKKINSTKAAYFLKFSYPTKFPDAPLSSISDAPTLQVRMAAPCWYY